MNYIGEISALSAAMAWAICAVITEKTTQRANSTDINFFVKTAGIIMISLILVLTGGRLIPSGVGVSAWLWLILSGVVGFAVGDNFLFAAYGLIGAKVTLMIFTLAPLITAILSWIFFGETLTPMVFTGMALVLSGLMLVVMEGNGGKVSLRFSGKGILAAVLASMGQAGGVILAKQGMVGIDALTTTQIRLVGGVLGLLLFYLRGYEGSNWKVFKDIRLSAITLFNAFLGTVVGVTLSMIAIANTLAAVASTLMAVTPVMVLPFSILFLKQKMDWREIIGALLSVAGIAVLFIL